MSKQNCVARVYPLYVLTTTLYGRHVDRRGEVGGPKLENVTGSLNDKQHRSVATRPIATYDRSVLTYLLSTALHPKSELGFYFARPFGHSNEDARRARAPPKSIIAILSTRANFKQSGTKLLYNTEFERIP